VQLEKSRLEEHAESIETHLRLLDESDERFKEENWNLELLIQDLRSQQAEQKETETRMQITIAHLEHEKTVAIKELDDMKHQFARVSDDLETRTKHTETEIGSLRRILATYETDKSGLQSKVEELKVELDESYKANMRLRSLQERQEASERDDPFGIDVPDDDDKEGSPPPSPTKHTPRHGQLEAETLKSSLVHAHRIIQNLRSSVLREKTEKNELKRMLQETRDELESARSGFSSPQQKEKRRRPDGTFKKLPRSSINLLGIARKSRDEIVAESPIKTHDDGWEEADLDDEGARYGLPPGAYLSSAPPTDVEGDSAFETANEKDSSDVFDTATENEAYRNGADSPIYDDPTSGDNLTETEGTPSRSLKPKASHLSSRSLRPLRQAKLRHQRSSIVSTASTEDEDDQYDDPYYRYQQEDIYSSDAEYDEEVLKTPSHVSNPRMKLRLNRARGKGTQRITSSDSSIFNYNVFGNMGSSPASGLGSPASFNGSPRGFNFRTSTAQHGLHKSLFAELGNNSPGMMSADGDEYGERGTPNRLLSPSLMPREMVEMVDFGVMTEEPYPDIPILLDDSASDATSDRPSTAITVVNDSGMLGVGSIFDRKQTLETFRELPPPPVMYDVGVQSEEEVRPSLAEAGVQSDASSTAEFGTQSDEIVPPETLEVGTQSDTASTVEFGTQSELPSTAESGIQSEPPSTTECGMQSEDVPVPETTEFGTQSDAIILPETLEIGTQSDAAPTTECGTQSDEFPLPETLEIGVQSDEIPVPATTEFGTQSDAEPAPITSEASTQFDPELEKSEKEEREAMLLSTVAPISLPTKNISDSGTQSDGDLEEAYVGREVAEKAKAIPVLGVTPVFTLGETLPVEEPLPEPVIIMVPREEEEKVAPLLTLVKGESIATAPVEEVVPEFVLVKGESVEITPVEEVTPEFALVKGAFVETAPVEEVPPTFVLVKGESVEVAPVEEATATFVMVQGDSIEIAPVEEPTPKFVLVQGSSMETEPVEEPLPEPVIVMVPQEEEPKEIPTFTLVKGESLDSAPVEESVVETAPLVLDFSEIVAVSTEPVNPVSPVRKVAPVVTAMPIITTTDASFSSDEDTPKKVSESTERGSSPPPRATTPTPSVGRGGLGFFGSLFGSRKQPVTPERAVRAVSPGAKGFSMESDDEHSIDESTVRQKDTPRRPALNMSVSTVDQGIQTELSSDAINTIVREPLQVQTPRKILFGGTPERVSVREVAPTPSLRSLASMESIALPLPNRLNGEIGGVRIVSASSSVIRPESSSSMRDQRMGFPSLPEHHQEHIAAAQLRIGSSADHSMAPPPVPTQRANVSFRPRTPGQLDQSRRPITPASVSHTGTTQKPSTKISTTRSEISSPGSRSSSLSSFVTEIDDRFNMQNDGYPARGAGSESPSTDPRVIQAITQTMIGEYLWKYTRNTGRGTISHTRHKRFFWIHPYTRTLYWSDRDPQSAGRAELHAKSVAIEAVRVVTDDNPTPPGLHRKSLVIITPGRTLKFTAPTSQRHETWFSALSYLLLRDGQDGAIDDTAALNDDDLREYNPQGGYSTESSLRPTVRGAASYSSFRSRTTRESSPTRNASSLSNRRPNERDRMQGSLTRLSNIFRPASAFGSYSSRNDNSVYGISEDGNSAEDLQQQLERHEVELERMENVRACCDGLLLPATGLGSIF